LNHPVHSVVQDRIRVDTKGIKKVKGLKWGNLRDHMNDLELIFSMLGEAATTEIARNKDVQGFGENKTAAKNE
jgi:hypothetical protein